MTILQASLDRSTVDDVDVDTTDAPHADVLGAAERRTFRAATLEEAVAAAASELGDAVTVIEANRIRRGGLGGFFATDLGVEVVVEKSPGATGSTADAVDRLLERFGERDADSFTPSIDRVELSSAATTRTVDAARVTPQAPTPQAVARQAVAQPHTTAAVSQRIESALRSEALVPKTSPVVDDGGPIFDLSDEDWDDEGPIFDLSDDDDRPADAVFDVDDETPVAAQRPTLEADDDDVFAPVAAEQHPFADQLEAELQAMSEAAESEVAADLVEPAVEIESVVEPVAEARPLIEPAIPAGLVEAPRNSPPPILDLLDTSAGEPPAIETIGLIDLIQSPTAWSSAERVIDEAVEANRVTSGSGPAVTAEVGIAAIDTADAAIEDAIEDATENAAIEDAIENAANEDAATRDAEVADTDDVETEDAALADLDALLRRAGVDPLAVVDCDIDLAPTLVDRPSPSPMPSSGLVFDAADRLSEQLNAIDGLSGRTEGLRRMQVKITGPDGTLVEMSAEWDGRG